VDDNSKYSIRAVDRALSVLDCFTAQQPCLTVNEVASRVGLHRSAVYRLLSTLHEHDYIEYDKEREVYSLGFAPLRLAGAILQSFDLCAKARPHMTALRDAVGETVHLGILDHNQTLVIEKIDSFRSMRMASYVGFRSPLYCTGVGKVLLAALPEPALDRALAEIDLRPHTVNTIINPEALRAHLQLVRSQGYALDKGETELDLLCVAAPIRDHQDSAIAAISISGPATRMTDAALPGLIETVMTTARRITRELGGHD
jgi:IclR family KDG regulon transcriptional repressor